MNEYTIILGAAMTAFIFINVLVKSWFICIAALIFGIGTCATMTAPINVWLFSGVVVVAVGQIIALIIVKHNDA